MIGVIETMSESLERVESLVHMQLNEFHAAIFAWPCVLSDRPPRSGGYRLEIGGMQLHDAVGINC